MTLANSLSADDLITELEIGKATLNFILERFSPLLNSQFSNGNDQYLPSVLPLLIQIRDLMSSGMLPSQIEKIIENEIKEPSHEDQGDQFHNSGKDIRMNQEALDFIRDMVSDIRGHQGRIARAHEKRAEAEERKAVAIEKRADAEDKKADAMNNIAMALQEMNQLRSVDSQAMEVAGQAARALTMDEDTSPLDDPGNVEEEDWDTTPLDGNGLDGNGLDGNGLDGNGLDGNGLDGNGLDEDFEDPLAGMSELLNHPEPDSHPIDTEDLDGLTEDIDILSLQEDEPGLSEEDLDDLSALIDTVSEPETQSDHLEDLLEGDISLPEPDDLSLLVDAASDSVDEAPDMDDLYSLVEDVHTDTDDLSLLVDLNPSMEPEQTDDLSALIDPEPIEDTGQDDLSLLVDMPTTNANPGDTGDDLWSLVDGAGSIDEATPQDDLSALIDPAPAEPSLKPDITPDEDLAKYKAAVMKIIIELKSQGLSAKETTDRLNQDEVATLSGKPRWREEVISKIYGFIDSTK